MSLHHDLLRQAKALAVNEPKRPRQASLRRAVPTSYYAVFHLLVDEACKLLIRGKNKNAIRHALARAFSHGQMKTACQAYAARGVNDAMSRILDGHERQTELIDMASTFEQLQALRHKADYDLSYNFTRLEALEAVERAEHAFENWKAIRKTYQAEAFLVSLLIQGNTRR